MATPKKVVEQSVGRIMRKVCKDGDTDLPIIVDILDNYSIFMRFGELRRKFYKKSKYTNYEYYALNDKVITKREFYKFKHKMTDQEIDSDYQEDNYVDYNTDLTDIFDISDLINNTNEGFVEGDQANNDSEEPEDDPTATPECMFD